jgi:hypothetical protein
VHIDKDDQDQADNQIDQGAVNGSLRSPTQHSPKENIAAYKPENTQTYLMQYITPSFVHAYLMHLYTTTQMTMFYQAKSVDSTLDAYNNTEKNIIKNKRSANCMPILLSVKLNSFKHLGQ